MQGGTRGPGGALAGDDTVSLPHVKTSRSPKEKTLPIVRGQGEDTCLGVPAHSFTHSFIHMANVYRVPTMCKGKAGSQTHTTPAPEVLVFGRGPGGGQGVWKPLSCPLALAPMSHGAPDGRYWCHLCSLRYKTVRFCPHNSCELWGPLRPPNRRAGHVEAPRGGLPPA